MADGLAGGSGGSYTARGGGRVAVAQGGAAGACAAWSCGAVGGGVVVGQVAVERCEATSSRRGRGGIVVGPIARRGGLRGDQLSSRHAAILLLWSFGASASTISMSGALGISISGTLRNFRVVEVHSTPCGASCSGR